MEQLLIDANVIAKYLKSKEGILNDILGSYKLMVSTLAVSELLAAAKSEDTDTRSKVLEFIKTDFKTIDVTEDIAQAAGDLVRKLGITLAQAIVAATAVAKDIPLLTYDIEAFEAIPELKLIEI